MNLRPFSHMVPAAFTLAIIATVLPTHHTLAATDTASIEEALSQSIGAQPLNAVQQQFGTAVEGGRPANSPTKSTQTTTTRPITPVRPPIRLGAENFVYRGDSTIAAPTGSINPTYFKSCLTNNYSLLGTPTDGVVPVPTVTTPIVGLVGSNISPDLSAEQIARLKTVQVSFRYAFQGNSQGARMRLALRNVNTNEVLQFGDFRVNGGTCQTFTKNLVSGFKKAGVYRLEIRLVNKPFLTDPGDPNSPLLSNLAVAGFDNATIAVSIK
jgi:hypothetical protein